MIGGICCYLDGVSVEQQIITTNTFISSYIVWNSNKSNIVNKYLPILYNDQTCVQILDSGKESKIWAIIYQFLWI